MVKIGTCTLPWKVDILTTELTILLILLEERLKDRWNGGSGNIIHFLLDLVCVFFSLAMEGVAMKCLYGSKIQ
jgi:hypothetical protein